MSRHDGTTLCCDIEARQCRDIVSQHCVMDGFYWLYSVNDNKGNVAANRKVISDGDVVEWNYTNEY